MLPQISLEYAHAYLGEAIKKEHEIGAQIAKHMKEILEDAGLSTSQLLLIDDYNSLNGDREQYSAWYIEFLESLGIKPTHLVWEADCVEPAKHLLDSIPCANPGFNQFGKYEKKGQIYLLTDKGKKIKVVKNGKYQCPLLAAVSEASQLGLTNAPYKALDFCDGHYSGNFALIILPSYYENAEIKAKRILSFVYGKNLQLHHLFFNPWSVPGKDYLANFLSKNGVINHVEVF